MQSFCLGLLLLQNLIQLPVVRVPNLLIPVSNLLEGSREIGPLVFNLFWLPVYTHIERQGLDFLPLIC